MLDAYGTLHGGDVVQGPDGATWGVEAVGIHPVTRRFFVTLVRHGVRVTDEPDPGAPVDIVFRADVSGEAGAVQALIATGLAVELIGEFFQS